MFAFKSLFPMRHPPTSPRFPSTSHPLLRPRQVLLMSTKETKPRLQKIKHLKSLYFIPSFVCYASPLRMYTHPPLFPFFSCLVARPPVGTKCAPIKRRHGLIRRPNLHLNKESLHIVAIRARGRRAIRGRPGVFPTEDIIHLFPL